MIAAARIKTSKEEECARKGTLYALIVCMAVVFNSLDHHEQRARYVERN